MSTELIAHCGEEFDSASDRKGHELTCGACAGAREAHEAELGAAVRDALAAYRKADRRRARARERHWNAQADAGMRRAELNAASAALATFLRGQR